MRLLTPVHITREKTRGSRCTTDVISHVTHCEHIHYMYTLHEVICISWARGSYVYTTWGHWVEICHATYTCTYHPLNRWNVHRVSHSRECSEGVGDYTEWCMWESVPTVPQAENSPCVLTCTPAGRPGVLKAVKIPKLFEKMGHH